MEIGTPVKRHVVTPAPLPPEQPQEPRQPKRREPARPTRAPVREPEKVPA